MVALRAATEHILDHPAHTEDPVVFCTDSQAALVTLRHGPAAQTSPLGAAVWEGLVAVSEGGRREVKLQWVPAHCDLDNNEKVDAIAKEATALPQQDAPVDVKTAYRAAARTVRDQAVRDWPSGWYRSLMGDVLPPPLSRSTPRNVAVDIHQLRAGHWSGSVQYMHRIGRSPSPECPQCDDKSCRAGWCRICKEEADTPEHILLRCPALIGTHLRHLGSIYPTREEIRSSGVVAALGAAARYLQSHPATQD